MKSYFIKFFSISKEYVLLSILLVLSLILLSFNSGDKINQFKIISFGTFALVNDFFSGIGEGFVPLSTYKNQLEINSALMLENSLMRSRIASTERMESLLELKEKHKHELLSCRIISKNGSLFDGRLIIDRGYEDGLKKSFPVIDEKGLIGITSDVHSNYALVKQLYNSDLNIAVTLSNTNTEGILEWNGYNLVIKNVPTTKNIQVNDEVFTSSFSSIFPPRIPIGKVLKVEASVAGILSEVVVLPNSDIEAATHAFVLLINNASLFSDSTQQVSK